MTWSLETSCGFESEKIAAIAVQYLQGKRVLDVGCGMRKVWPSVIGIDNGHHFGQRSDVDISGDGRDLSLFADQSIDAVFSSHTLEHFDRAEVPKILNEWARVLKVGGRIVLYTPSANLYPRMGQPGANPDHKWDIEEHDIFNIFAYELGAYTWTMLECEERSGTNEYSWFHVFRKEEYNPYGIAVDDEIWQRNPGGKKRALVIRYGAIGDMLQTSAVFKGLKKQGYHVTLNCQTSSVPIIQHDPNIDEWFVQERDFVPNQLLGPYWQQLMERYDYVVNLCESIEGALLTMPGRLTHMYPVETRRKLYSNVNYIERLHDIAGTEFDPEFRFYTTAAERRWAMETRAKMLPQVVVWAINGSSPHKVYPWTQIVCSWINKKSPVHIVLMADAGIGKELQKAIIDAMRDDGCDMSRVHGIAGEWDIRQSLSFAQFADCVVGPETGITNAVAFCAMPKFVYLSHSSKVNLTRDWLHTTTLIPDKERAPCYPCHRLHYSWEYCAQNKDTKAAACASGIEPEMLFRNIMTSLIERQKRVG